jgi:hypothetical protein
VKILKDIGYVVAGIVGLPLTLPILLVGLPIVALHAAGKDLLDALNDLKRRGR